MIFAIRSYLKIKGMSIAILELSKATELNQIRTLALTLYGNEYRKSLSFKRLELGEQIYLLRYNICKAIFNL